MRKLFSALQIATVLTAFALAVAAGAALARPSGGVSTAGGCASEASEIDLQGLLDQAIEQNSPVCGFIPGVSCEDGGVLLAFGALIMNALAQLGAAARGALGVIRRFQRSTEPVETMGDIQA